MTLTPTLTLTRATLMLKTGRSTKWVVRKMAKRKSPRVNINLSTSIEYSQRVTDWKLWVNKADELIEAARLLEPHVRDYWRVVTTNFEEGRYSDALKTPRIPPPNPQSAHFMLIAFALENLMKAIVIRSRPNEFRSRLFTKLPLDFKTHDLRGLAKKANVPPTTLEEEDLLCRLSRVSTWAGRYPIPIEDAHLKNVETYSDGKPYLTAYFSPKDADCLNDLLLRVRKLASDYPHGTEVSGPQ